MNLTERQQYELLAAISARGEIPVKFAYLGEGAERWDAIHDTPEYGGNVTNEEAQLLSTHFKSFLRAFDGAKGINLVDLGCGSGLPAIGILRQLAEEGFTVNYVPVDLSREMLALASKNVKQVFPQVNITEVLIDFENESLTSKLLDIKQKTKLPNLMVNLGNTLGNYVNVDGTLTNFLQSMTLEDYLIVGNGLINDQNPRKVLRSYVGIDSVKELITAPAKELGLFNDLDEYQVEWNASQRRVEIRIKLGQDRQLQLAGQSILIEKGDELLVAQSRKYTEASLTKILSGVGFRTELLTTNRHRGYVLAMIQPTRYSTS